MRDRQDRAPAGQHRLAKRDAQRDVPEREVVEHGAGKELDHLRHHSDSLAALRLGETSRIETAHPNDSRPRCIETSQQMQEARLASTRTSDYRDVLAGG